MSDPLGLISNQGVGPMRPAGAGGVNKPQAQPETSFKDVLLQNIEQVNQLQQEAESAIEDLASGRRDDVDGVLIAKQKADLAFQMLLQVRNKMLDSYEEIKQMRI